MDREFGRRSVLVTDQILRRGNEVVKNVLLLQLGSCFVPLLAILAAAAHVCRCINEPLLKQSQPQRTKAGRIVNVETAVAVKHRRVVAVELQALLVHDEHWDARAVLAVVEHFLGFVVRRFEAGDLRLPKHRGRLRRDVILKDRRRKIKRGESIEGELVVCTTAEAANRSRPGKLYFVFQFAIETINVGMSRDVFQVRSEKFSPDFTNAIERLRFLRNNVLPILFFWIFGIKQKDAAVGCIVVGVDQKLAADIVDHAKVIVSNLGDDWHKRIAGLRQIAIEKRSSLLPVAAVGN